jgi:peptide-methionine (S)-S-oxide reductase
MMTAFLSSIRSFFLSFPLLFGIFALSSCQGQTQKAPTTKPTKKMDQATTINNEKMDTATFANGCFWCTEAIFEELKGVASAVSGYTGGHTENPTYKEVCNGTTGHAECIQITFDPSIISYDELLEVFWKTHDPTTLNRQGNDIGTQYRSAIFYHSEEQKQKAAHYKKELDESGAWSNPIVTEISPFTIFYPAENYHQQYFEVNGDANPYCQFVIQPKLEKFRKVFADKRKKEAGDN